MTQTHARYIQIDDWYFEIKTVRALKVDEYGKPYSAIANCNINGNQMYVDGLLTKDNEEFNKKDFATFYKFCQKAGLDSFSYHRFQDGESINKEIAVSTNDTIKVNKRTPNTSDEGGMVESTPEELFPMRLVK